MEKVLRLVSFVHQCTQQRTSLPWYSVYKDPAQERVVAQVKEEVPFLMKKMGIFWAEGYESQILLQSK